MGTKPRTLAAINLLDMRNLPLQRDVFTTGQRKRWCGPFRVGLGLVLAAGVRIEIRCAVAFVYSVLRHAKAARNGVQSLA